jgi:hypothetical protein
MKVPKPITALKMRRNLGQTLEDVYYRENCYIIERAGRPMAALVPIMWLSRRKDRPTRPPIPRDKRASRHRQ